MMSCNDVICLAYYKKRVYLFLHRQKYQRSKDMFVDLHDESRFDFEIEVGARKLSLFIDFR